MVGKEITWVHWVWVSGFGLFTLLLLFGAAEFLIKGKLNAPSIILAGFMIALASVSLSFFIACLGDLQMGRTDTLDQLHRVYKQAWWFTRYW